MNLFKSINDYGKMIKFSHTIFALPFAGLSAVLATLESNLNGNLILEKLIYITICMAGARSAAMGFNRIIDRDIDEKNPRTRNREIPSGTISIWSAWTFIIISSLFFFLGAWLLNPTAFKLSPIALAIILFYSYTKRFTWLCHFVLGLGIGIAPTGAWIAIREDLNMLPVLWTIGLMFHIAGFDILYSTQDFEFDKSQGLKSIPARFGVYNALIIAKFSHIVSFTTLAGAGYYAGLGIFYYIFLSITGVLFLIEHLLVKPDDLSKVPIAFFHINASISVILFIGVFLDKWTEILNRIQL